MPSLDDAPADYFRQRHQRSLDGAFPLPIDGAMPFTSIDVLKQGSGSDWKLRQAIREDLTSILRYEFHNFTKELRRLLSSDGFQPQPCDWMATQNDAHREKAKDESQVISGAACEINSDLTTQAKSKSESHSDMDAPDLHLDPMPVSDSTELIHFSGSGTGSTAPGIVSLFEATTNGKMDEVVGLLRLRADPNARLETYTGPNGKIFNACSLLSVAVLNNRRDLVRLLVERKAHIDSRVDGSVARYGFKAGSLELNWSGEAHFIPIVKGNVDLLKQLIELRANPHTQATNKASLIWQACYFGASVDMLRYLLELRVNPDIPGESQDIAGVSFTPLHLATVQGHLDHVACLLKFKTNATNVANKEGNTPLRDAIRFVHPEICMMLVSHGAKFVESDQTKKSTFTHMEHSSTIMHSGLASCSNHSIMAEDRDKDTNTALSPLELLFKERNPVLVHAVAEGLKNQERQVAELNFNNVFKFLQTGDSAAKIAIFKSIFRNRDIFYRGKRQEKIPVTTAMLKRTRRISDTTTLIHLNVVENPCQYKDIHRLYHKREFLSKEIESFLDKLLPRNSARWRDKEYQMTSVAICESIIPDFHHDLSILREIKNVSSFDPFLSTTECRAVIESNWNAQKVFVIFDMFIHFSLLIVYFVIVAFLNANTPCKGEIQCLSRESANQSHLAMLASMGVPFVMFECLSEFLEFVAHVNNKWAKEYLSDMGNVSDWFRIALDWVALVNFLNADIDRAHEYVSRVLFALCCFIRWNKMLFCLTPFRKIGFQVMPILFTLRDIGPFITIFWFYILGFAHAYVAMHIEHDLAEGFLEVLYFSMIPEEFILPSVESYYTTASVEKFVTRCFLLLATFALPVALMNILIAAMNNSYSRGVANMERLYQSRVANCVFSHEAFRSSIRSIFRRRVRDENHPPQYLWYCYERDDN